MCVHVFAAYSDKDLGATVEFPSMQIRVLYFLFADLPLLVLLGASVARGCVCVCLLPVVMKIWELLWNLP